MEYIFKLEEEVESQQSQIKKLNKQNFELGWKV